MPDARIKNLRSGWLYETTTSAAPTNWTPVVLSDGVMNFEDIANGYRLFRVTADAAQYGAKAYTVQVYSSSWVDVANPTLDVPTGNGNFRADAYQTNNGSLLSSESIEAGHHRARFAYEQQVELERSLGCIFDYSGTLFRGVESGRTDTKQLEEGGLLEGYDVTITTSRKQWADNDMRPLVGAVLTRGGKRFKVETIVTNDGAFELGLMKKHG